MAFFSKKLIAIFITVTVIVIAFQASGPDFSGVYVGKPGTEELNDFKNIRLPYTKLTLNQSGKDFKGHMDVYAKDSSTIRYEITKGFLGKDNHLNLDFKFEPDVEVSANVGFLGISGKAVNANFSSRSTHPLTKDTKVIEMEGLFSLGGALGAAMEVLSLMVKEKPLPEKREVVKLYRIE